MHGCVLKGGARSSIKKAIIMKPLTPPAVVNAEQWLAARRELLALETAHAEAAERLAASRREMPWVKVDDDYVFEGPAGRVSLADLFGDKHQLIVYHFMFQEDWDEGCKGCSFFCDHLGGVMLHIGQRDIAIAVVSIAPLDKIQPFKQRMGWTFPWVSSHGTSFNRDFGVSFTAEEIAAGPVNYNFAPTEVSVQELPGLTVFARDAAGEIYRTYSAYSTGLDGLLGVYQFIDLTPRGRDEDPDAPMEWVRHHDRYDAAGG